jgi:hypothetical protein
MRGHGRDLSSLNPITHANFSYHPFPVSRPILPRRTLSMGSGAMGRRAAAVTETPKSGLSLSMYVTCSISYATDQTMHESDRVYGIA